MCLEKTARYLLGKITNRDAKNVWKLIQHPVGKGIEVTVSAGHRGCQRANKLAFLPSATLMETKIAADDNEMWPKNITSKKVTKDWPSSEFLQIYVAC